jgi:Delta7-sterol 5-desaturase
MMLLEPHSPFITLVLLFIIICLRYLLFAGGAYFVCWKWKREKWQRKRINPKFPPQRIIRSEIAWSVVTSFVFAITGVGLLRAWQEGYTLLYSDVDQYGWAYLFVSFALVMFLHDTYFYWTHRWMHRPIAFRRIHRVHHQSYNPTPWATFSFHPIEALIEAVILPALVFIVPLHIFAFLTLLMTMTVLGVINHLGYELFPTRFSLNKTGNWLITATHHQMHHQHVDCNFGLYFTVWDHWMGTQDSNNPKLNDRTNL